MKKKMKYFLLLGILILCTGCKGESEDSRKTMVKAENVNPDTESSENETGYSDATNDIEGDWQDKESGNFYTFDHGKLSIQNTEGNISEKTYRIKKYSDRYELEVTGTDGISYTYKIKKTEEHTIVIETAEREIVLTGIIYEEKES